MRSRCPRCTLLGFALSALLHLGITSVFLWQNEPEAKDADGERQVAVSLAMFAGPEGGVPQATNDTPTNKPQSNLESEPEPAEPAPTQTPESVPEPILQTKPFPEPEPKLEPEVEPKSAPESPPKVATKPKPKPKSKPKPKPKPVSKPVLESKPEIRPTPRPAPNRSTRGDKKVSSGGANLSTRDGNEKNSARAKALEQKYLAGLRRAIAKKRRYPASARRRGDAGVVTISFVIAQNGRISGARVDKSSGSSALDKAAVETLRRLGRYKPIPKTIGRSQWSLRVPIRFALE